MMKTGGKITVVQEAGSKKRCRKSSMNNRVKTMEGEKANGDSR